MQLAPAEFARPAMQRPRACSALGCIGQPLECMWIIRSSTGIDASSSRRCATCRASRSPHPGLRSAQRREPVRSQRARPRALRRRDGNASKPGSLQRPGVSAAGTEPAVRFDLDPKNPELRCGPVLARWVCYAHADFDIGPAPCRSPLPTVGDFTARQTRRGHGHGSGP